MVRPPLLGRPVLLLVAAAAPVVSGCLARPPAEAAPARFGLVRAATAERAGSVAELFDELAPRVSSLLPDARLEPIEIWLQENPALYAFQTSAYSDADGFWAEGVRRIHLREGAEQIGRTLAHELVHASLGRSWRALPGTLEEGVCDLVATRLCPDAAARLRAGRLASAALAVGGLSLDIELVLPPGARPDSLTASAVARVRLVADPPVEIDPDDVFVVQAGLSSTRAGSGARKALYGLGYLLVERIEQRIGLHGLHELCAQAGRGEVAAADLRRAADLEPGPAAWRAALAQAFGPAEVREVLRLHPQLLVGALLDVVEPLVATDEGPALERLAAVRGRISIAGSPARLEIEDLRLLWPRLERALAAREAAAEPR